MNPSILTKTILKHFPVEAMHSDSQKFQNAPQNFQPEINFYHFSNACITYGYTLEIEKFLNLNLETVRRPTGGGFVIHQPEDLIFSFLAPLNHPKIPGSLNESFLWLADIFKQALAECGFKIEINSEESHGFEPVCFAHAREFEITYLGKKVLGIAQRRGKNALLMQGALALKPIDPNWKSLLKDESLWQKMEEGSGYLPNLDVEKFVSTFNQILKSKMF